MNKSKESNIKKTKRAYVLSLGNGTTRQQAAEAAGVSCFTIWNWAKQDEEFTKEIDNALESRINIVVDSLFMNAVGKGEYVNKEGKKVIDSGNVIAQIFWAKNRGKGKWKDKQEIDIKVPDTIRVKAFIQAGAKPVIKDEEPEEVEEKEIRGEDVHKEIPKEIETIL